MSPLWSFNCLRPLRRDQQRIVPGQLRERSRQLLQPRIVGIASVPQIRIRAKQDRQRMIGQAVVASDVPRPSARTSRLSDWRCPE